MPLYEYRCRTCDERFDARRSFDDADGAVTCPSGHEGAVRLLAAFASTGRAGSSPGAVPVGGGACCGGGCGCG